LGTKVPGNEGFRERNFHGKRVSLMRACCVCSDVVEYLDVAAKLAQ